jgi:hypothetical protein
MIFRGASREGMLRVRAGGRKEPSPIIAPYGIRIIYEDTTSTIVGHS